MSKYVRVMYDLKSDASGKEYKLGEISEATNWYKDDGTLNPKGGFYFSTEEGIVRWLLRGDTIYDVVIPDDAIVIDESGSNIVYRTNKIIINNPKKITDEFAVELYKKSKLPETVNYRLIGILAMCGYEKASLEVIKDKVNKDNIDEVIDYVTRTNIYLNQYRDKKCYDRILLKLKKIKKETEK